MIALPDIDVLLALAWSNHAHHEAAPCWFARDAAAGWATCLLTQTGFLRLSLNPQVVDVRLIAKPLSIYPRSRCPSSSEVESFRGETIGSAIIHYEDHEPARHTETSSAVQER